MSEQNINTRLLNHIEENLTGDTQKNALNFVQHLISIGMTAKGSINDSKFIYKGKKVCDTYFGSSSNNPGYPEPWNVWTTDDYDKEIESIPIDSHMKEVAWANVHNCDNCGADWCSPDKRRKIFDRDFDNLCVGVMAFTDPNAEAVECMKEMLEIRKMGIRRNQNAEQPKNVPQFGCMQGEIWMSDDFDEPLTDFKE